MLAQNFMTPTDLGLSKVEFDALVLLLGYLERGDLPGRLDLSMWIVERGDCNTSGCLAGWAWHLSGHKAFGDIVGSGYGTEGQWSGKRKRGLVDLFLPGGPLGLRPERAPLALRNYMTHGDPNWASALGGDT